LVPLPISNWPFVGTVVKPVPPAPIPSVPPKVSVPELVIGPPVKVSPVEPPEALTLVTVPAPDTVAHVGSAPAPFVFKSCPLVPGERPTHPPEPRNTSSPCVLPITASRIADNETPDGTADPDELLANIVNADVGDNEIVRLAVKSPPPDNPVPDEIVIDEAAAPIDDGVIVELDADVMRPYESIVIVGEVDVEPYVPAETPLVLNEIVPVVVIVPPDKPVPAVTDVTLPEP